MTNYLLTRSKVRDFAEWKSGYDAHISKRQEAGLTEKHLLQAGDDANEVFILFEAADLNRAKAFVESADLKEAMQKASVVDEPDFYFLNSRQHNVFGQGSA